MYLTAATLLLFSQNNLKNNQSYFRMIIALILFLTIFFKVNHFPKSYELTRKDLMNRNVSKMAISHGVQHFNFVPKTYLIPSEMSLFLEDAEKNKG